jgi:hypothetical protein
MLSKNVLESSENFLLEKRRDVARFVFCVVCVRCIYCPQESIGHGNKDALYEKGISIEYHGHSVIKLHVFPRTNSARGIWNRIQIKALKGVVQFTYGISIDREKRET